MNSLAFRLKDLGKTQNLSLKMLCLTLTISMLAIGTVSFAADNTPDKLIQVSTKSDRSISIPLSGSAVKGDIHIFVPSSGVELVSYFLDTNGDRSNSAMTSGKRSAPFDFAYTNPDGSAKAFNTTTLVEGKHTLIATVKNTKTNRYTHHTSQFIVDNVPDRNANPIVRVSASPNRSGDKTLDLSKVSGNVYVFVEGSDIKNTAWFLDTNGNYATSNMTTGNSSAPFDFQYKEQNGDAKPLDTTKLSNGSHELSVRIGSKSTGQYVRHNITFTVNNSLVSAPPVPPVTAPPATQPPVIKPPTTQPPTVKPPVNTNSKFAGDVPLGFVRWGASIGSNSDPVSRHGSIIGNQIGLRRTFYGWTQMNSMVKTAQADATAGRVPWISIKPGGSWKDHGDGKFDTQTRQMFVDLGKASGPVWFTFHHEPEGGGSAGNRPDDNGGPEQWLRAQTRISQILRELQAKGQAKNVAFGPVLMGYTFQKSSGRNPNDWYKPGIWDFAGIDAYARTETTASPILSDGLPLARQFYGDRGLKIAIGEWAVRTQETSESTRGEIPTAEEERIAGERVRKMYDDIIASGRDGKGAQIIGAAYFDTSLNSGASSYELTGNQLKAFRELISFPTSLRGNQ